MRTNIKYLITVGLGYCCLYGFFRATSSRSQVIADRLGVSKRGVNYRRQLYRRGLLRCERCDKCMLAALRRGGR